MATDTVFESVSKAPALTAKDRCDRCGAQAYVRVFLMATRNELMFCGHDSRVTEAQLIAKKVDLRVYDQNGYPQPPEYLKSPKTVSPETLAKPEK